MGILSRKKEPTREEDLADSMAMAEQSRPQTPTDSEMVYSMGRSIYMVHDPDMAEDLRGDEQLKNMYPAYSMLNRLSNIPRSEVPIFDLEYDIILKMLIAGMPEEQFNIQGWIKTRSMRIHGKFLVREPVEGWKGKILTEQMKVIRTEVSTKKKGIL